MSFRDEVREEIEPRGKRRECRRAVVSRSEGCDRRHGGRRVSQGQLRVYVGDSSGSVVDVPAPTLIGPPYRIVNEDSEIFR